MRVRAHDTTGPMHTLYVATPRGAKQPVGDARSLLDVEHRRR
jgi:hypothetical protein